MHLAGNEKANSSTSNTSTTTASSANPAPPAPPVASGTTPTPPPPGMVVPVAPVATGSQTPKKDATNTVTSPDDSALLMSPTTRILPREQLQLVKGGNLPRVPDCFQRTPKKVTLQSLATGNKNEALKNIGLIHAKYWSVETEQKIREINIHQKKFYKKFNLTRQCTVCLVKLHFFADFFVKIDFTNFLHFFSRENPASIGSFITLSSN